MIILLEKQSYFRESENVFLISDKEWIQSPEWNDRRVTDAYLSYLPTTPLGQDMTQGQFLSVV